MVCRIRPSWRTLCVLLVLPSTLAGLSAPLASDDDSIHGGAPQAISLLGVPLVSPEPSPSSLENLDVAREAWMSDPRDLEKVIWYGRRTAYTGDYRGAIAIYSDGLELFPDEPRLLRHRGHRLITLRKYDAAIADFERALVLIRGTEDQIEQDGLPNPQNIPISSLHGNIRYHLGLAYYLTGRFEEAIEVYRHDLAAARNDDQLVSTSHWLYMALRRRGRHEAAQRTLEAITEELEIIENHAYHRLCLYYQGLLTEEQLRSDGAAGSPTGAATEYGIANWFAYTGQPEEARRRLQQIVDGPGWPAFGFAAAEADLAREAP